MDRELKFRAFDTFTEKMIFEGFHLFGEVLTFQVHLTEIVGNVYENKNLIKP
jgi:hypothetical protein